MAYSHYTDEELEKEFIELFDKLDEGGKDAVRFCLQQPSISLSPAEPLSVGVLDD